MDFMALEERLPKRVMFAEMVGSKRYTVRRYRRQETYWAGRAVEHSKGLDMKTEG